jgi:hypothetical protein
MAPEVMACGGSMDVKYDVPADIWSIGCVVIGIHIILELFLSSIL